MNRERTVTWDDPMAVAAKAREMDGREFLQTMIDGDLPRPPIAWLLGMTLAEVGEGTATFGMDTGEYLYNPIGVVHGGAISTLMDSALGCAVQTMLKAGTAYTTVQLNVNFVRAVTVDVGFVKAEATVIKMGRQVATAEARVVDENGKLYAHATTTCLIFPAP